MMRYEVTVGARQGVIEDPVAAGKYTLQRRMVGTGRWRAELTITENGLCYEWTAPTTYDYPGDALDHLLADAEADPHFPCPDLLREFTCRDRIVEAVERLRHTSLSGT